MKEGGGSGLVGGSEWGGGGFSDSLWNIRRVD